MWIITTGQQRLEGAHVLEPQVCSSHDTGRFVVDEYLDRDGELVDRIATDTTERLGAEPNMPPTEMVQRWVSCADDGRRRLWIDTGTTAGELPMAQRGTWTYF